MFRKVMISGVLALVTMGMFACGTADVKESGRNSYLSDSIAAHQGEYVMVIHGGAGTMERSRMTPEREAEYKTSLEEALRVGYEIIQGGGSSLDAVEQTIHVLENNPLFNAGRGAVFTNEGRNELDASIMDGSTGEAGAVAGVTILKNPISAARAVMERSEHVMMVGKGAEQFGQQLGLEVVDPSYFHTESRWNSLQRARARDSAAMEVTHTNRIPGPATDPEDEEKKFGTVGCVAIDQTGRITAGTSTGGMNNKRYGRVGDSPIIGAGTFANKQVGVSCTGWGEFYIRHVVAYDIAAMMDYKNMGVEEAAQRAIDKVGEAGGDGGIIALDKDGHVAMPFNTSGMYRGVVTRDGQVIVEIFK